MNRSLRSSTVSIFVLAIGGVVAAAGGCSSGNGGSGFSGQNPTGSSSGTSGGSSGGSSGGTIITDSGIVGSFGDASTPPPSGDGGQGCTNLQCQVQACSSGSTTISGTVKDPAGHNPLYNVVAFIPNTPNGTLPLIPIGINSNSCSCDALFQGEEPMADALTAPDGTFTIKNAPSGTNIPLVVQIGKWRKEIIIPSVTPCQDNAIGAITLPKNTSDGKFASIPNIAVSTGSADTLECLLTRIGIDEAMFSGDPNSPSARVHVFVGNGNNTANPAGPSAPTSLWDSDADLQRYDITLLSCEGSPTAGANPQTIADYVGAGGRVFGEHYHYAFFANQTQFANTATWSGGAGGKGGGDMYPGAITGTIETTLLKNGQTFPEGVALNTWLGNVGALSGGTLPIPVARHDAVVSGTNVSTAWVVSSPGVSPASTQYFSWDMPFNAPVDDAGVPQYCGRVVFSDLHVSGSNPGQGNSEDYTTSQIVPTGCDSTAALLADEDALEFILFDLSSCVTPVGYPPKPPPAMEGGIQ
jgi:hypothetical protein